SRAAVASFGGSGPYQMVGGLWLAAARRSGPGQANTFASLQMIHERSGSRPRRALVTAGTYPPPPRRADDRQPRDSYKRAASRPSARGSFRLEFGVEMLISRRHLA